MDQEARRRQVLRLAAEEAVRLPLKDSGYWFHGDLRDNVYFALHVLAAMWEGEVDLPSASIEQARGVLLRCLQLQDRDASSAMYGHFPLGLGDNPAAAKPNTLPVELMGTLLMFVYVKYGHQMDAELKSELQLTLTHVYQSGSFRRPLASYHHHEAKYVALQIGFGLLFDDKEMYEEGCRLLTDLLASVKANGMREYAALPWFWHWVQAFTCVWNVVPDPAVKQQLADMLEYLWETRAVVHLKGAWAGPRMRSWPHDLPADRNVLLDYIAFGNFDLPAGIPRLEAAGLLRYLLPERIVRLGIERDPPYERKRLVPAPTAGHPNGVLHTYLYMTGDYAVGGVFEYRKEFDNEQHRWDVTLPIRTTGANHAYFYHPGERWRDGDDRHTSEFSEVLPYRNTVAAIYNIPDEAPDFIVGCLPPGEWRASGNSLFGCVGDVYLAVTLGRVFTMKSEPQRVEVRSVGRTNAVVIEAVSVEEAAALGVDSLQAFGQTRASRAVALDPDAPRVEYESLFGDRLVLGMQDGHPIRELNGTALLFGEDDMH